MDGDLKAQKQMEANLEAMVEKSYDLFDLKVHQTWHTKGANVLRPHLYFGEVNLKGWNCKTCLWSIARGIGDNASHITWGGVGVY